MNTKKIEIVIPPRPAHFVGDGFRVHNFIPSAYRLDMARMSPFIMLDYNSTHYFPPTDRPRGVGVHPHRGFETVTLTYKGKVAHHDSYGNHGVIGQGDVQWMTAAAGILHKEYHEEAFSKKGGEFQMVQLWVNLPAKYKMSAPKYQGLANADIPKVKLAAEASEVEVIAGQFQGTPGAASTFSPVHLLNTRLKSKGEVNFKFPATYNTALLVIEGAVTVNTKEKVATDHFVLFENEGEAIHVSASEDALFLVMSGEPINEPIAAQGPFVMNTQAEIAEAIHDYNTGKFGFLED